MRDAWELASFVVTALGLPFAIGFFQLHAHFGAGVLDAILRRQFFDPGCHIWHSHHWLHNRIRRRRGFRLAFTRGQQNRAEQQHFSQVLQHQISGLFARAMIAQHTPQ